jgi:hypothetical protein
MEYGHADHEHPMVADEARSEVDENSASIDVLIHQVQYSWQHLAGSATGSRISAGGQMTYNQYRRNQHI